MPLTETGTKVLADMEKTYSPRKSSVSKYGSSKWHKKRKSSKPRLTYRSKV